MNDKEELIKLVTMLQEENEKLKEILLEAGATTHKSKKLYDWYCENTESKE
jgi:3-dehydroquinate dehydratase